jgi:hypothetical protein
MAMGQKRPVSEGLRPKCAPAALPRLPVPRVLVLRGARCRHAPRTATRLARHY